MTHYLKSKKELTDFFTEEYYNTINYTDYTSRTQKYNKTAEELVKYLKLDSNNTILDYGCAVGMLLNGFLNLGLKKLNGFDISTWAVSNKVNPALNLSTDMSVLNLTYDVGLSFDVFEHMFDDDISQVLSKLNTKQLLVRIPVKVVGEDDFYLEVSRRDKSHINCKTKGEWVDFIETHGYRFIDTLELETVYDSKGCFCGRFIK